MFLRQRTLLSVGIKLETSQDARVANKCKKNVMSGNIASHETVQIIIMHQLILIHTRKVVGLRCPSKSYVSFRT